MRDAHTAVGRRAGYSYHVEPVLQLVEGCVCEEGFASRFGIAVEEVHFCFGITFGQDGYVYAVLCRTASMQVAVRGDVGQSALVDEDIIGAHFVGERCRYLLVRIL